MNNTATDTSHHVGFFVLISFLMPKLFFFFSLSLYQSVSMLQQYIREQKIMQYARFVSLQHLGFHVRPRTLNFTRACVIF